MSMRATAEGANRFAPRASKCVTSPRDTLSALGARNLANQHDFEPLHRFGNVATVGSPRLGAIQRVKKWLDRFLPGHKRVYRQPRAVG